MEITTTDIQLFQILKQKLGEKEAEALVNFVESKLKASNDANLKIIATKEDLLKLQVDIEKRFNQQIIWIVATAITVIGLLSGIMFAMLNIYIKH